MLTTVTSQALANAILDACSGRHFNTLLELEYCPEHDQWVEGGCEEHSDDSTTENPSVLVLESVYDTNEYYVVISGGNLSWTITAIQNSGATADYRALARVIFREVDPVNSVQLPPI